MSRGLGAPLGEGAGDPGVLRPGVGTQREHLEPGRFDRASRHGALRSCAGQVVLRPLSNRDEGGRGGLESGALPPLRVTPRGPSGAVQEVPRRRTSRRDALQEVPRRRTSRRGAVQEVPRRRTSGSDAAHSSSCPPRLRRSGRDARSVPQDTKRPFSRASDAVDVTRDALDATRDVKRGENDAHGEAQSPRCADIHRVLNGFCSSSVGAPRPRSECDTAFVTRSRP